MKKILSFTIYTILLIGCNTAPPKETKPNIIFILADDFGYMDVQGYAQRTTGIDLDKMYYETPNLNKLMSEGVSFSHDTFQIYQGMSDYHFISE